MMKRTVTIVCTQELTDSEWFRDRFVPALHDFANALEAGTAGNDVSETFEAGNGIELWIEHTKDGQGTELRLEPMHEQEVVC